MATIRRRPPWRRRERRSALLFHPDYTVGFGLSPNLLTSGRRPKRSRARGLAPHTAGGEFHPAPRMRIAALGSDEGT